mmetsp:Transcript_133363/g.371799  ORF Transcript_133363/g.371799 Transcript_133363/m.371799 type:complete len:242 (-) Transcript_133363:1787-2512(-)
MAACSKSPMRTSAFVPGASSLHCSTVPQCSKRFVRRCCVTSRGRPATKTLSVGLSSTRLRSPSSSSLSASPSNSSTTAARTSGCKRRSQSMVAWSNFQTSQKYVKSMSCSSCCCRAASSWPAASGCASGWLGSSRAATSGLPSWTLRPGAASVCGCSPLAARWSWCTARTRARSFVSTEPCWPEDCCSGSNLSITWVRTSSENPASHSRVGLSKLHCSPKASSSSGSWTGRSSASSQSVAW